MNFLFLICRLLRYWFKGFKVSMWEVWMDFFGVLDNVCWNENGDFWVVFYNKCMFMEMYIGVFLWLCYFVVKFFIFLKYLYVMLVLKFYVLIFCYSFEG